MSGKSTDSALARDILEWNIPEEVSTFGEMVQQIVFRKGWKRRSRGFAMQLADQIGES